MLRQPAFGRAKLRAKSFSSSATSKRSDHRRSHPHALTIVACNRFPAEYNPAMDQAQLIDSHAHLDGEEFAPELEALLARARAAGVAAIVTIGTELRSSLAALALARRFPELQASAGVHPHEAGRFEDAERSALEALWAAGEVAAIGEAGLDYYYDFSPAPRQREVLRWQIEAARRFKLPCVFHVRDAFDDFFEDLGTEPLPAGGVLHCFSGGPAECEAALARGLHISLSGIVTFPKAAPIHAAAKLIPADRLLVETDAPYLAPVPYRGKRNEPSHVVHTARKVAELRGESYEALCEQTLRNTLALFRFALA